VSGDDLRSRLARHLMEFSDGTNRVDGQGQKSWERFLVPMIKGISRVDGQENGPAFRQVDQEGLMAG
jgi:hypothetical protein